MRGGKASAWERLGWGVAAGFFGVGVWAAGKFWFLGRELERYPWGELRTMSDLRAVVSRAILLGHQQTEYLEVVVLCGLVALAAAVGAWVCRRKRRKAEIPGFERTRGD